LAAIAAACAAQDAHAQGDRIRLRPPGVLHNGVAEAERNAAGEYVLRDARGRRIGTARERLLGSWVIYDERGRRVGTVSRR
jgi:hypothetical protein